MLFSTPCSPTPAAPRLLRSARLSLQRLLLPLWWALLCAALCWAAPTRAQEATARIAAFALDHNPEGLYLSARVPFALAPSLQDALTKGVPLHFVAEAELLRDRWYWYDKTLVVKKRTMRLSYAPLARRYRVAVVGNSDDGSDITLNFNFSQLQDALAALQSIARWKIANAGDLRSDREYTVAFRYALDLSQLPRPMQIGVDAQSEWNIRVSHSQAPPPLRPSAAADAP